MLEGVRGGGGQHVGEAPPHSHPAEGALRPDDSPKAAMLAPASLGGACARNVQQVAGGGYLGAPQLAQGSTLLRPEPTALKADVLRPAIVRHTVTRRREPRADLPYWRRSRTRKHDAAMWAMCLRTQTEAFPPMGLTLHTECPARRSAPPRSTRRRLASALPRSSSPTHNSMGFAVLGVALLALRHSVPRAGCKGVERRNNRSAAVMGCVRVCLVLATGAAARAREVHPRRRRASSG